MPSKRKRVSSEIASKRQKVTGRSSAAKSKKPFPLLELPPEILDNVLCHVITIPNHPRNASCYYDVIDRLFLRNLIHCNRVLRQKFLALISREVLWLEVKCLDDPALERLEGICSSNAILPPVYRNVLAKTIPKVTFEVGDPNGHIRRTRNQKTDDEDGDVVEDLDNGDIEDEDEIGFGFLIGWEDEDEEEDAEFMFPFNYQSFAELSARLSTSCTPAQNLTIRIPDLPLGFQHLVDQQILPMVRLFRYGVDVRVERSGFEDSFVRMHEPYDKANTSRKITDIITMVQSLDTKGRKLEATLLCIFHGFSLVFNAVSDPNIGRMSQWAHPDGALAMSNWETNASNLQRMKLVRSLHYIEYRACLGYIEAVNQLGFEFARMNFTIFTNLPLESTGNVRWSNHPSCVWYGLPDHELAEMHHAKALMFYHLWDEHDSFEMLRLLSEDWPFTQEEIGVEAFLWAYYAWSLDMENTTYKKFLLHVVENIGYEKLEPIYQELEHLSSLLQTHCQGYKTKIRPVVLGEWEIAEDGLKYLDRAQQVAKMADVAYDKRRGDELPKGYTEDSRKAQQKLFNLKPLGRAPKSWAKKGPLFIHNLGLSDSDALDKAHGDFSHIAPWKDWQPC